MHRRRMILSLSLALVSGVGGCASVDPTNSCPAGLKPMSQAELFFGRAIPGGGTVSDADWQHFLDEEVTPRFPDGLTVTDGVGQWRDATGIVREASKRLTIILSGAAGDRTKLAAIRAAYRRRFRQEAVLLMQMQGCGGV